MTKPYTLSKRAGQDIQEIYRYSRRNFGLAQTEIYISGLENSLEMLADKPLLGRSCTWLLAGFHRFEYISHVIFYTPEDQGIFIARILHKNMNVDTEKLEEGRG